ncbi:GPO family capsid scaffolding protein [Pantoea allii]|uniref:GPO family capsid scaffolding protein n=1 Tax=Pantoea allii TaxID=574096 RepID=UPI003977B296
MTVAAKRFRIGVEGATTDGREISREWLVQMADAYNPSVYTATINLEHLKSYAPDSTFNRYGTVSALVAEEIKDGPLAGKMALYADILPTGSLVELVKKGQKLFTSMEVNTKFADTGKAYLVGLAATDDPASLGTEMLQFSASAAKNPLANRKQHPDNLFTAAAETVIELEDVPEAKPALFKRIQQMFSRQQQTDDARFSDVHQAVELIASEQQSYSAANDKAVSEQAERIVALELQLQETQSAFAEQQTEFNELKAQLSQEDGRRDFRQRAPGGTAPAATLTNC